MRLPVAIGDYVDFYSSLEHATNVGRIFRPDAEPLPPNWRHLPIGYHGRAGSVVVSGTPVRRPYGQLPREPAARRVRPDRARSTSSSSSASSPARATRSATPIPTTRRREHVFGFVLVNDWSARDIQRWEYQPLGPFLGKSFATSISPWVVPLAALEPYRVPAPRAGPGAAALPAHERGLGARHRARGRGQRRGRSSRGNARGLYWTSPQQLAHATVNGADVRPGDLFASGHDLGRGAGHPRAACSSSGRGFLADGDAVVLRGWCGEHEVSFGEVAGTILPAGSQ